MLSPGTSYKSAVTVAWPSQRIRDWLLKSAVQVETGQQAGAVAGWADEQGKTDFVYGEATGYFLSAMAHIHATDPAVTEARIRARKAFDWVERSFESQAAPITYSGLVLCVADWRNEMIFSFDLAMILQGVNAARGLVPEPRRRRLANRILAVLLGFISKDGRLQPWKSAAGSTAERVPDTWSTNYGAYQAKAASAILRTPESVAAPELADAAKQTIEECRDYGFRGEPLGPLHPYLYYLEGLTTHGWRFHDSASLNAAAAGFERLLQYQHDDGSLPGEIGPASSRDRSDVQAQALRLGCVLERLGLLHSVVWKRRSKRLAECLTRCIHSEGAAVFLLPPGRPVHLNTTSSAFAYQAFYVYENGLGSFAAKSVLANFV